VTAENGLDALADRRRAARGRSIPKISLLSAAGIESAGWGIVIAHLVKWAVSFGYFATWQLKYPGPLYGNGKPYLLWYGKDFWDRLPVHVQNGLPGEVAVLCGLATAGILIAMSCLAFARAGEAGRKAVLATGVLAALACGCLTALEIARLLSGWHVHWFPGGGPEPAWWITWRHDIRDVGITLIATIIVRLMFAKPKYGVDDNPGPAVYLTRMPLAIGAALIPVAIVGVIAWKLPWLTHHGVEVPARYGAAAAASNEWLAAGTWIASVMGILGGLVATRVIQRVADDIQWFWAERSAAKLRAQGFLSTGRVIGTPAHRLRVHWLLDNSPELPVRSPWLVRIMVAIAFLSLLFAGAGAWLNLAGPAAH
jgi:hypothetical protein